MSKKTRKKAKQDRRDSALDLLRILWLYPNYRVDYRSVRGGIQEVIRRLRPKLARRLDGQEWSAEALSEEVQREDPF